MLFVAQWINSWVLCMCQSFLVAERRESEAAAVVGICFVLVFLVGDVISIAVIVAGFSIECKL